MAGDAEGPASAPPAGFPPQPELSHGSLPFLFLKSKSKLQISVFNPCLIRE